MLLAFYNKVCRQQESYGLADKVLLGLCALIVPLSFWSLWLPSNHFFLFGSIALCLLYWGMARKRLYETLSYLKALIRTISSSYFFLVPIALFLLFSVYFYSWEQSVYDSLFYHHQNIRWNEEFAVVPGLGNLDDRYGFNSNYLLLSAVFTFRFVLSEAIYPLQPFIVTIIGSWILYEFIRSGFETRRLFILVSYILLCWVSIYFLGNTSTDILPNFIIFYIVARLILYPHILKENYLLLIILPVFLLTCKLSSCALAILSVYLIYQLIKNKRYLDVGFLCTAGLIIVLPWLVRNVIISGYLIYPLYQIDLFSFDWKVPLEAAVKQKAYIFSTGYYFLRIALRYPGESMRDPFAINILTDIILVLSILMFLYTTYFVIRQQRKKAEPVHILLYAIFAVAVIVWLTGGADIRFIVGVLCAIIFTGATLLLKGKVRKYPLEGRCLIGIFILSLFVWTTSRYNIVYSEAKIDNVNVPCHILLKPYTVKDQQTSIGLDWESSFSPYLLNNGHVVWINTGFAYDKLPARTIDHYALFLPVICLESRGKSLQDGFRAKADCR
ncbi:hypothetical protein D0T57_00460 [Dysgonomonas sp. 511]|nr:hypothetical protein [Dysgonomonas sp. 511]